MSEPLLCRINHDLDVIAQETSTTADVPMEQRSLTPELMDDPAIDPLEHRTALRGLSRLNRLSRAPVSVAHAIRQLLDARNVPASRASLLDLACGGGDLLLGVRSIIGPAAPSLGPAQTTTDIAVDISSTALDVLRERAERRQFAVRCLKADVLAGPLPLTDAAVDVSMCSLFLHHLTHPGTLAVLREMARIARLGIVISDLSRTRTGLSLAWCAGRLLTRSRVVHADSVSSVRAAWTRDELTALAREAGLLRAEVRAIWPERLLLIWRRE